MNKDELLQAAQSLSNWAFMQGYEAALKGIDKNDIHTLRQMPEACNRINELRKIFNIVMGTNIEM